MIAVSATVVGRVQGVGFRIATAREAARLGVDGWCRNAADGSVSVHAQGSPKAVDALVGWLHAGPRHASVRDVHIREAAPESGLAGFDIR